MEYGGYMYASAAPLPNIYQRLSSPRLPPTNANATAAANPSAQSSPSSSTSTSTTTLTDSAGPSVAGLTRANSTSRATRGSTKPSRFHRHQRTASSSSATPSLGGGSSSAGQAAASSRSSHEAVGPRPSLHRARSHDLPAEQSPPPPPSQQQPQHHRFPLPLFPTHHPAVKRRHPAGSPAGQGQGYASGPEAHSRSSFSLFHHAVGGAVVAASANATAIASGRVVSGTAIGGAATATGGGAGGDPPSPQPPSFTSWHHASSLLYSGKAAAASAPAVGAANTASIYSPQPPLTRVGGFSTSDLKHVAMFASTSEQQLPSSSKGASGVPFSRTESISSASGTTSLRSGGTMTSSDPASASGENNIPLAKPFVQRNGRTYLNDASSIGYPLPVDLAELHRQSMRTLLLIQVFGGPVCSPTFATRPPLRVLEVGCGSGFWSMMCHRYFAQRGHSNISFTGIDVAPLAPGSGQASGGTSSAAKPDRDMRWKFVQHDLRHMPWPLAADEFDLVMVKDMSLATTNTNQQRLVDEYLRVLRPGGTLEIWESDHTVRMLRPHALDTNSANSTSASEDVLAEHDAAASLGAYVMTANTPLSAPLNNFLVEYNSWLQRALEARDLSAVPCTLIGPMLLQESEALADVRSRRLAIPLSEVRWEREGVGGVVTKDGKSYIETGKGKGRADGGDGSGEPSRGSGSKTLTAGQAALRRTALMTVVQLVQSLEPLLRESSGKSQDEWDVWLGKLMSDVMGEKDSGSGTSWGECLEVGAWWAKKKQK